MFFLVVCIAERLLAILVSILCLCLASPPGGGEVGVVWERFTVRVFLSLVIWATSRVLVGGVTSLVSILTNRSEGLHLQESQLSALTHQDKS